MTDEGTAHCYCSVKPYCLIPVIPPGLTWQIPLCAGMWSFICVFIETPYLRDTDFPDSLLSLWHHHKPQRAHLMWEISYFLSHKQIHPVGWMC